MQFKSKQYIKAVQSYATSALSTNAKAAVICRRVVDANRRDLSDIVTNTMMAKEHVIQGIIADVASCRAEISRNSIRNVWKQVVIDNSKVSKDGSVVTDEQGMDKVVNGIKNGDISVVREGQDKAGSKKPTKKDHVFTFINNHAKPMTKAQSIKAVKRIMSACGLSLSDLK